MQEVRKLKRYSFYNLLDRRAEKFATKQIFVLFVKSCLLKFQITHIICYIQVVYQISPLFKMSPKNKNKQIQGPAIAENISLRLTRWVGSTNSLIAHSVFFALMIILAVSGVGLDKVLLILTTVVSLEAIYLSIFIQMSVNRQATQLTEVSEDIEEIQEDMEEIQEDVEEIEKDMDEIQKDIDEIQEDVEEIEKEEETNDSLLLTKIQSTLAELMKELAEIKKK